MCGLDSILSSSSFVYSATKSPLINPASTRYHQNTRYHTEKVQAVGVLLISHYSQDI
uniref:Uncharacterized protein n=1 Tax=Arion vulgaris TaxID=1028688 RepID=A0A0B6YUX0_9EUPU